MPIWGILLATLLVLGLSIVMYYLKRPVLGKCSQCNSRLTEDTSVHISDKEQMCVECYSKLMLEDQVANSTYLERYYF